MDLKELFDESLDWMTLRLTGQEFTFVKMKSFATKVKATKWVIGHEVSGKKIKHSHMVLGCTEDMSDHNWKKAINDELGLTGNSQFSKSRVRTSSHRAIQYCIKDGKYESLGFSKETLAKLYKQSTKKFDRKDFVEALTECENLYYTDKNTFREFAKQIHRLRISYGQNPNRNSQRNYLTFHYHKKDILEGDKWIDDIVDHIVYTPDELFTRNGHS